MVKIVVWRLWRSLSPCVLALMNISGEIGRLCISAFLYPGQQATATNPAILDWMSCKTLKCNSFILRWSSNHVQPSGDLMIRLNATSSFQMSGGFALSTVMMLYIIV